MVAHAGNLNDDSMSYSEFNDEQKLALLELLVMGMYADDHLALAEDARLITVLATLPAASDDARARRLDEIITRAGRHAISVESRRARTRELAKQFPTLELRQGACAEVEALLSSDREVSGAEQELLLLVKEVFQC